RITTGKVDESSATGAPRDELRGCSWGGGHAPSPAGERSTAQVDPLYALSVTGTASPSAGVLDHSQSEMSRKGHVLWGVVGERSTWTRRAQELVLRRILAIVLIVLGLGTAGAAVASGIIWRPSEEVTATLPQDPDARSEEHTSELQSRFDL